MAESMVGAALAKVLQAVAEKEAVAMAPAGRVGAQPVVEVDTAAHRRGALAGTTAVVGLAEPREMAVVMRAEERKAPVDTVGIMVASRAAMRAEAPREAAATAPAATVAAAAAAARPTATPEGRPVAAGSEASVATATAPTELEAVAMAARAMARAAATRAIDGKIHRWLRGGDRHSN